MDMDIAVVTVMCIVTGIDMDMVMDTVMDMDIAVVTVMCIVTGIDTDMVMDTVMDMVMDTVMDIITDMDLVYIFTSINTFIAMDMDMGITGMDMVGLELSVINIPIPINTSMSVDLVVMDIMDMVVMVIEVDIMDVGIIINPRQVYASKDNTSEKAIFTKRYNCSIRNLESEIKTPYLLK